MSVARLPANRASEPPFDTMARSNSPQKHNTPQEVHQHHESEGPQKQHGLPEVNKEVSLLSNPTTETTTTQRETPDPLPQLNYNIWDHKPKLYTVCILLIIESSLLPISLFYSLWYGTTLRHGIRKFFTFFSGLEASFQLQPSTVLIMAKRSDQGNI